jgi:hypothetical protein
MYELARVDSATTQLMLKDASNEGFRVVRFWAFEPTCKTKLNEICDLAKECKIYIIPVLADPSGYLQSYKINQQWYRSGYKKSYLAYITDLVSSFKDRKEILLWELINEPMTASFSDIYDFTEHASGVIKSADPNHLVSIGTIGGIGDKFGSSISRFSLSNFETLYSIKSLDAVSLHDYSFGSTVFERLDIFQRLKGEHYKAKVFSSISKAANYFPEKIDVFTLKAFEKTFDFPLTLRSIWKRYNRMNLVSAAKLDKPVYIGEVGFKKSLKDLRKLVLKKELRKYFNDGISGVLLWSFESQGKSLDGHDYGFNIEDGFGEVFNLES